MDRESVKTAFDEAKEAVKGLDPEFRPIAFEVLFRRNLEGGGRPVATSPVAQLTPGGTRVAGMAMGEFMAQVNAKTYPDRISAIAYYHVHSQGEESVTREELFDGLSRSRIAKPKNLSDVIAQCVRKGHLMDAEPKNGQKAWTITMTGDRHIEGRLSEGSD
jgi:hypothetical protein